MTRQPSPRPVATQSEPDGATPAPPPMTTLPAERTRRWLAGAMLVTVGLVAGSGATYAFTSSPTGDAPGAVSGYGPRGVLGGSPTADGEAT